MVPELVEEVDVKLKKENIELKLRILELEMLVADRTYRLRKIELDSELAKLTK